MKSILSAFIAAWLFLPVIGLADRMDHDLAKELREAGEIVPLQSLLSDARSRHSGRILEIELEYKRDTLVYEIEMVDDDGRVQEYFYDARDGRFLWEEIQLEPEDH